MTTLMSVGLWMVNLTTVPQYTQVHDDFDLLASASAAAVGAASGAAHSSTARVEVSVSGAASSSSAPPPPPLPPIALVPPPPALEWDARTRNFKFDGEPIGNFKTFGAETNLQSSVYCRLHKCNKIWRTFRAPSHEAITKWYSDGLQLGTGREHQAAHMRLLPPPIG